MTRLQASLYLGARIALRPIRRRTALVIAATTVAFSTLASFAERKAALGDAAGRSLQGPVFGLALPLAAFALVSLALSRGRVEEALNPAACLSASRRAAALGAGLGVSIIAAALGGAAAAAGALAAHGPPSAASFVDAATACWIGALTSVAYAFLFLAASTIGAKGGFRIVVLLLDLVLGPLSTPLAALSPRAHALNLLGGSGPVPGFSQPASSLALFALILLFCAILLRRVRP